MPRKPVKKPIKAQLKSPDFIRDQWVDLHQLLSANNAAISGLPKANSSPEAKTLHSRQSALLSREQALRKMLKPKK